LGGEDHPVVLAQPVGHLGVGELALAELAAFVTEVLGAGVEAFDFEV
jgi:hypothetical protein